jgi:hypothetical protein
MKNYKILQIALPLILMVNTAYAIDLQPGEIAAPPRAGIKLAQYSFQFSQRGDIYRQGDKAVRNSDMKTSSYILRLGSTFEINEMPAIWYVQSDIRNLQVDIDSPQVNSAKQSGLDVNGDVGGSDTSLVVAIWPYVDRPKKEYFGIAAYLTLPSGAYHHDRLFNVGENRYRTALQVGYQTQLSEPMSLMVAFDSVFFGNNNDFTPQKLKLEQDHLHTLQTGIKYQLNHHYSVALAYFYTFGGESYLNNVSQDDRFVLQRYQLTAQGDFNFGRLTAHYGSDIKTEAGMFEEHRLIMRYTKFF